MFRIPLLDCLIHILFPKGIIGIGIPLIIWLFMGIHRFFTLGIMYCTLASYNFKLRNQFFCQHYPLMIFLIGKCKDTGFLF